MIFVQYRKLYCRKTYDTLGSFRGGKIDLIFLVNRCCWNSLTFQFVMMIKNTSGTDIGKFEGDQFKFKLPVLGNLLAQASSLLYFTH